MADFMEMIIEGTARDAHERFPITYNVSQGGTPYFNGCRVEALIQTQSGQTITKRMDIRAFGDLADQLAHVTDGTPISVKGSYDMNKANDGKYYPVLTVSEIIFA